MEPALVCRLAEYVASARYWHLGVLGVVFWSDMVDIVHSYYGDLDLTRLARQREEVFNSLDRHTPLPMQWERAQGEIDEFTTVFAALYHQLNSKHRGGSSFGSYCATLRTLWHVSTRQRIRRLVDLFS